MEIDRKAWIAKYLIYAVRRSVWWIWDTLCRALTGQTNVVIVLLFRAAFTQHKSERKKHADFRVHFACLSSEKKFFSFLINCITLDINRLIDSMQYNCGNAAIAKLQVEYRMPSLFILYRDFQLFSQWHSRFSTRFLNFFRNDGGIFSLIDDERL